jgi:non-ribosomal peptide synthetase component E (peptide arylation enzyme)
VVEAAVVSMPHERLGEGVCAFIIAEGEPPSFAEISAFIGEQGLAKQKRPERIEYVDSLPRTASGKVRKDLLRERIKELVAVGH